MDYMQNYTTGRRWERIRQEDAEIQRFEAEQRRHEESERRASETRLPQLAPRLSGLNPIFAVQHDMNRQHPATSYIAELDATPGHPNNRMQQPPTPPASATECEYKEASIGPQANTDHQLHAQIQAKNFRIEELEAELQSVRSETLSLRAERDKYEKEHIQAILNSYQQEAIELRHQIDQLAEYLNEAKAREQKLEADLDTANSEKRELRRRLRRTEEEKSDMEHDLERVRTTTNRESRQDPTSSDAWRMLVTELLTGDQGDGSGGQENVQSPVENQAGREASQNGGRSVPTSRRSGRRLSAISVPRGYRRECGPVFM